MESHPPTPKHRSASFWKIAGLALIASAFPLCIAITVVLKLIFDHFWPETVPTSGLMWGVIFSIGSPMMLSGIGLLNRARQLRAQSSSPMQPQDQRPPVLYLRAFQDDEKMAQPPALANINPFVTSTQEENLVEALQGIGPVIAIGRPNEPMPPLGAQRLYVDDDVWQTKVDELMTNARLIVFRLGAGDGLRWEIEHALRQIPLQRLLFYGAEKDISNFLDLANQWLPQPMRLPKQHWLNLSPAEHLIYFDIRDQAQFVRPANSATQWRSNLRKPLLPVYQIALRPIFEQLGIPWSPPPIPWRELSILIGLLLTIFGSLLWLAVTETN